MAYNWLRLGMGATIGRALRQGIWAPAGVLLLALIAARLPSALDPWWLLHILGGAALAFWFSRLATIEVPWRYVVAFALACTGVVAWEAGEFAVDQLVGTALQEGNLDTMTDLLLSVCGAAGYLSLALTGWRGRGGR